MRARKWLPGGLRAQIALAISLVTTVGVLATYLALYTGSSARLRAQIDASLQVQREEWHTFTAGSDLSSAAALERDARRFIQAQRYHAESLVIVVQVSGGSPPFVSNSPERGVSTQDLGGILGAPVGLSTTSVVEAGTQRVLVEPIRSGGRRVGTLRLASSLASVAEAQSSFRRTFLIVGLVMLALAIAAGVGLAGLIAAPLRRMAGVAAAVQEGDLEQRAGPVAGGGEVGLLARALDDMLDRIERTLRRQRDFVSDASHELRTPLAVLRAQVELLDRETDAGRRHAGTAVLLRRLDELDRLVADMLTLASAEAGQLIEVREIDLEDFFEDVRRDLALFGEREFELRAVSGTLRADPDRLTQVLRNLIRNAVNHTDPGGRVSVAAAARGDRLEIAVSDDGPGIAPEQLELIFERFHRADGGRSRERGGTGLGLAIARAIVEAHGGTLAAESSPGRGATFRVALPGYERLPTPVLRAY